MQNTVKMTLLASVFLYGCNSTNMQYTLISASDLSFDGFRFDNLPLITVNDDGEKISDKPSNFESFPPTSNSSLLGGSIATCENTPSYFKRPGSPDINLPYKFKESISGSLDCRLGSFNSKVNYRTSWTVNGDIHTFSGSGENVKEFATQSVSERFSVEVKGDKCRLISYSKSERDGSSKTDVRMGRQTKCFVFPRKNS